MPLALSTTQVAVHCWRSLHPMLVCVGVVVGILLTHPVAAHNVGIALAYPVEGITIDGDFADWPDSLGRYPIAGWQ